MDKVAKSCILILFIELSEVDYAPKFLQMMFLKALFVKTDFISTG